jgi:hypothetical protein
MPLSQKEIFDRAVEFADSSLADLYDPDAMPKKFPHAFDLCRKYTEPLIRAAARSTKIRSKVHQA